MQVAMNTKFLYTGRVFQHYTITTMKDVVVYAFSIRILEELSKFPDDNMVRERTKCSCSPYCDFNK